MEATDCLVQTHQELGREKGEGIEAWAGVTKKAEMVAWQKLAYGEFVAYIPYFL